VRRILVDTNVWLRRAEHDHAMHEAAARSVARLLQNGAMLCIIPQTLYEFWAVTTRPATSRSGLGWTPQQCEIEVEKLLSVFHLMLDTSNIYHEWRRLVTTYNVSGMSSHDARLVAAMRVHNIEEILTFNFKDFIRYTPENIRVLDPSHVAAT